MLQQIKTPDTALAPNPENSNRPSVLARMALPLLITIILIVFATIGTARWDNIVASAAVQTTDDAYVRADMSRLGARVAGTVTQVAVEDYQSVKTGDLLIALDPEDYLAKKAQADAALAFAVAQLDNLQNQAALQNAAIQQATAQGAVANASAEQTGREANRQASLVKSGSSTLQKSEEAQSQAISAAASAQAAEAAVNSARAQLSVIKGQYPQLKANVEAAKAQVRSAELALSYTKITAPFDGVVGERQLHVGDFVNVGTNAVTLVPLPHVYLIANFKETQLSNMKNGQRATIRIDALPNVTFTGKLNRLSPASGSQFALLPPDNATGNFTKVVQRVSVRVDLDKTEDLPRIRPGMSATVSIAVSD